MSSPAKGGSQPYGWQINQAGIRFVTLGEN